MWWKIELCSGHLYPKSVRKGSQRFNSFLRLIWKTSLHTCDPSSWRDALIVEPSSTESSRFYYEELPDSGNIYLKIESGGKKEIFLLPFTLPTPTIATTISSAYHPPPQRDYFRLLNSSLHSLYSWLDLQKFFPYEYF